MRIEILVLMLAGYGLAWGGLNEGLSALDKGDYDAALLELRPLAQQGDAKASVYLGDMYYFGWGVQRDYRESLELYRYAAENGVPYAQLKFGLMHYFGRATIQDYVQAHKWLNIAAANGVEDAMLMRDTVAQHMTPYQLGEAQRLAREWTEKHQ